MAFHICSAAFARAGVAAALTASAGGPPAMVGLGSVGVRKPACRSADCPASVVSASVSADTASVGAERVVTRGNSSAGVVDEAAVTVRPLGAARCTCCSVVGNTAESLPPTWPARRVSSGTTRLSMPPMPARALERAAAGSASISDRPTIRAIRPTVEVLGSGSRVFSATMADPQVAGSGACWPSGTASTTGVLATVSPTLTRPPEADATCWASRVESGTQISGTARPASKRAAVASALSAVIR